MNPEVSKLHALLFIQSSPLSQKEILGFTGWSTEVLKQRLVELSAWLEASGVELLEGPNGYQLSVSPNLGEELIAMGAYPKLQLTNPMLEVLAVVAHKQPVEKQTIDEIRGVGSEQTLRNLISLGLVEQLVLKDDPLKLIRYRTTEDFLLHAGLNDIKELAQS